MELEKNNKRIILQIVEEAKKTNIPKEQVVYQIKSKLSSKNINLTDNQINELYNECQVYLYVENSFYMYKNKTIDSIPKAQREETVSMVQIYLKKRENREVSSAETNEIMLRENIGEELAKQYLYNNDGTKKRESSLVEDKLLTIYLRTDQYEVLDKNLKQLMGYNEQNKKMSIPDDRAASKYIRMLKQQEKYDEVIAFFFANQKILGNNSVINNQLFTIYDITNNTDGCLNIAMNIDNINFNEFNIGKNIEFLNALNSILKKAIIKRGVSYKKIAEYRKKVAKIDRLIAKFKKQIINNKEENIR